MSSVGPQLPPHLQKRKRSPSDPEDPSSPPSKILAAAPRAVGPSLPPSKNPEELDIEESSDDDYGPSIPKANAPTPPPKRRVLGPAPPPAPLSEKPSHPADSESSDDDDDDYGPSLPPPPGSYAETEQTLARAHEEERERNTAAAEASKPKRAEWMLVPPTDSDWTSRVDPTKLKNRKFASGKGAKAPAEKSGISAIWTETPEEKRQRLEDEVLGRKDAATSARASKPKPGAGGGRDMEEEATARRIQEYNNKNRNRSLYEEHAGKDGGGKEKEDDPSKRDFDREKDMALGGRLGHGEKREMLAKARDFGSRFERGKYL